jgi:hypothetical protein
MEIIRIAGYIEYEAAGIDARDRAYHSTVSRLKARHAAEMVWPGASKTRREHRSKDARVGGCPAGYQIFFAHVPRVQTPR